MLGSPLRVCATVYLSIILSVTFLSFTLVRPNVKESSVKVKLFKIQSGLFYILTFFLIIVHYFHYAGHAHS